MGPLFQTADLLEEPGAFDIAAYVRSEFVRRFGHGTNGRPYDPNQGQTAGTRCTRPTRSCAVKTCEIA